MIIDNVRDLIDITTFIDQNEFLAFDIETTGLMPSQEKIIGFGVSNSEKGFYVVHLRWNGSELEEVIPFEECKKILAKLKDKQWTGWNSSFECRFCMSYFGVDLVNSLWSDGMLAKHTVDEERPFALKELAKKLYGDEAVDEQALMKESIKANGGNPSSDYFMADAEILGKYCIQDCLLTFRINEHYLKEVKKQRLEKFFFVEEVMPMYKEVIIPMESKGVVVDVDLLSKYSEELKLDIENQTNKIMQQIEPHLDNFYAWYLNKEMPPRRSGTFAQLLCKYYDLDLPKTKTGRYSLSDSALEPFKDHEAIKFISGGPYLDEEVVKAVQNLWWEEQGKPQVFNLSSKDHLKRLFFDELQEEPVSRTEKGNPQVDHLFLMKVADKYEWVKDLMVFNRLVKLQGTYIDRYLEQNIDGSFFPGWFMHRTTSGRLGGDLMQLPRKVSGVDPLVEKYNNVIRDCIISGSGRKLVGADYSSLEVVVFADDSEDPALLDMIRNGEDFYSKTAIGVHGLSDEYSADKKADNFLKNHKPDLRQDAKVYSLGLRYGMQSFKLSKTLNISTEDADEIIDSYFHTYPDLKIRMDNLIDFAKKFGYVKSRAGRVRHLPMLKKLHFAHGEELGDSLSLWKKYHGCPKKYKQMKYLSKQYRAAINNALNFPIQSMAASITNRACVAISREFKRIGLDAHIIMQIHDEIVVSAAEKDVERVVKIMKFLMENTTKLSVPLNADPEVGNKYGDIK
jgi:DNA polymerase I-like protein with 3'-5' exonuclease and polymerase domains